MNRRQRQSLKRRLNAVVRATNVVLLEPRFSTRRRSTDIQEHVARRLLAACDQLDAIIDEVARMADPPAPRRPGLLPEGVVSLKDAKARRL